MPLISQQSLIKFSCKVLGVIALLLSNHFVVFAQQNCEKAKELIDNGSLLVVETYSNKVICSYNAEKMLTPASIIKIVTAAVALDKLGSNFHFQTNFWISPDNDLIIEGFGDPFLISEEIQLIAKKIKALGITKFNSLKLNVAAFEKIVVPGVTDSIEPYDAPNGALLVNFNTAKLGLTKDGQPFSAEDLTPLTAITSSKAKELLAPGTTMRINIGTKAMLDYCSQLFIAIFAQQGIYFDTSDWQKIEKSDPKDKLLFTHYNSRSILDNISAFLKYSNNMQANQLLLNFVPKDELPANLGKALAIFKSTLEKIKIVNYKDIKIHEGAGISADNKISAQQMIEVLQHFHSYKNLLPTSSSANIRAKSGTLTKVYNYAGYIQKEKSLRSFVIMLNQSKNNRDSILKLIAKID